MLNSSLSNKIWVEKERKLNFKKIRNFFLISSILETLSLFSIIYYYFKIEYLYFYYLFSSVFMSLFLSIVSIFSTFISETSISKLWIKIVIFLIVNIKFYSIMFIYGVLFKIYFGKSVYYAADLLNSKNPSDFDYTIFMIIQFCLIVPITILELSALKYFILEFFKNSSFKNSLNFISIMLLGSTFISFYSLKISYSYLISLDESDSFQYISIDFLDLIKILIYLSFFVAALIIYANIQRYKIIYLVISAICLLLGIFILLSSSIILRKSSQLSNYYESNCQTFIRLTDEKYLSQIKCLSKYIKTSDNTCSAKNLAIHWEDDYEKLNSEKLNKLECLNLSCCSLLTHSYIIIFKNLGISFFFTAIISLCASGILVYLVEKSKHEIKTLSLENSPNIVKKIWTYYLYQNLIEIITIICFITLFISGLFYLNAINYPKNRSNTILDVSEKNKYFQKDFTKDLIKNENDKYCQYVSDSVNQENLKKIYSDDDDKNSIWRFAFLTKDSNFKLTSDFNSKDISIFSFQIDIYKKSFYPLTSYLNTDFKLFQGKISAISNFLKNDLKICCFPYVNCQLLVQKYKTRVSPTNRKNIFRSKTHLIEINTFKNSRKKHFLTTIKASAKSFIDLYEFNSLSITVLSTYDNLPVSNAQVYLLEGIGTNCEELWTKQASKARSLLTNKKGEIIIHNVIKKTYTIFVRKNKFKNTCWKRENGETIKMKIFLVKQFKESELKIILFYKNLGKKFENILLLNTAMNINEKTNCFTGGVLDSCQFTNFIKENNKDQDILFQQLDIKRLFKSEKYLIFIINLSKSEESKFMKLNPYLQLYIGESDYSIADYFVPSQNGNEDKSIWLCFCIGKTDGKIFINHLQYILQNENKFQMPKLNLCD